MSRNSDRASIPELPETNPQPSASPQGLPGASGARATKDNPFGISFVVPTQHVSLPSEGRFYSKESVLYGVQQLEIKHLTSKEEDILTNSDYIESGIVFDKLLSSILIDTRVDPSELMAGDKMALLIAARATGYGSEYETSALCKHCGKVGNFAYNIGDLPFKNIEKEGVTFNQEDNTFNFTLPKSEISVDIRVLTGHEEKYLQKQEENKKRLGLEVTPTADFIKMVMVRANGVEDQTMLNKLSEVLPAIDSKKIVSTHAAVMPGVDLKQNVACSICGEKSESEVPFSLGFFWPNV